MRNYSFDTFKLILIYMVVLGHFLIMGHSGLAAFVYRGIYVIHMPLFIFVMGYFSKKFIRYSKQLFNRFISFLVLNIIFIICIELVGVLFGYSDFEFNFFIQNGASWYLLVSAIYCLITPILLNMKNIYLLSISFLAIMISVIFGESINYLCFTYFLSHLPIYVLGLKLNKEDFCIYNKRNRIFFSILFLLIFIGTVSLMMDNPIIRQSNLYYKHSFIYLNQSLIKTVLIRLLFLLNSVMALVFFLSWIPNKNFKISTMGSHTFSIYFFHIFFRDILRYEFSLGRTDDVITMMFMMVLSGMLVFLLSKKPFIYIENILRIKWIK